MKRVGLYVAILLIAFMALAPLYAFKESLALGKISENLERMHWSTNNTTRVWGDEWQAVQNNTLQLLYPAGLNRPDFVLLVPSVPVFRL